ncbi:hypothetical protein GCM10022221_48310 [Actinocorallia aurea]
MTRALHEEVARRYARIRRGNSLSRQRYGRNSPFAAPPAEPQACATALYIARQSTKITHHRAYREQISRLHRVGRDISKAISRAIEDKTELPGLTPGTVLRRALTHFRW